MADFASNRFKLWEKQDVAAKSGPYSKCEFETSILKWSLKLNQKSLLRE